IHTGSRGLGYQNCSDYLRILISVFPKYHIQLPDRELACVPFNSKEGQNFFSAMACASNFAWANRHMIMEYTRMAFQKVLGKRVKLRLLYDVAHNIAKIEEHESQGEKIKLIVHRKGATRAFPPHHPQLPPRYQKTGQPVIIPGSMGTSSFILVGEKESKKAWHSVCHGAGRVMSRHSAMRQFPGQLLIEELKKKGIVVKCRSLRGISEEAPGAYKDIEEVIDVVEKAQLAKKIAQLFPLAVIKGE
ncbi:MAG: RtcB family protein, partial [Minisyncoccales bacterium]